ncbi:MAG: TolC family protein [Proteobacteria bacterium]|nr:TolC family protein [Pseudomonadota bacterium]
MKKLIYKYLIIAATGFAWLGVNATAWAWDVDPFNVEAWSTPNPQTYWPKPIDLVVTDAAAPLAAYKLPHKALTLTEVTDFALQNNPDTRLAWFQAKAAAAQVGVDQSAYLPQLTGGFGAQYTANWFSNPNDAQTTYGPNFSFSYLLLDFGNRSNTVLADKYAQIAANLNQNNAIQQVILNVQQAYYDVLGQQALVTANQENVKQAKASLEAAQALRANGLKTIGDVYQAAGSYAQAQLDLQTSQGNFQTDLGQLATTMGLPANTPLQIVSLQNPPKLDRINQNVARLLSAAKRNRPDLLAAEAQVRQSQAELAATRATGWPTLSVNATAQPGGVLSNTTGTAVSASLTLSVPLFTGFSYTYSVKKAQAQMLAAQASRDQLNQQVQFQVWQAYFALKTAEKNIYTTETLLKSSQQAYQQAFGQYKNGVGDILSVLTTQSTLANARVQYIQAQLNWYIALAQLAAAIGDLTPATQGPLS